MKTILKNKVNNYLHSHYMFLFKRVRLLNSRLKLKSLYITHLRKLAKIGQSFVQDVSLIPTNVPLI